MSNEHDTPTGAAPTSQPGPDILTERTLTGIFVHLIGLFTSFVGPLLIYTVSDHEFTRANARNAMNWQIFYLTAFVGMMLLVGVIFVGMMLLSGVASVAGVVLPNMIAVALFAVVFVLFSLVMVIVTLGLLFSLVAMAKAIFGNTWEYPIAPDFFELDRISVDIAFDWWKLIAVYALAAPLLFGALLWEALVKAPDSGLWFGAVFATLLFVFITSLFAPILLYRDMEAIRDAETALEPNWVPYLGGPIGAGVVTYLGAAYLFQSQNPSGDAVYGYMAVLWVASVVYLYQRHRSLQTP